MKGLRFRIAVFTLVVISLPGLAFTEGKLSLKIQGGWAHFSGGDLNPGTQAWIDYGGTGWDIQVGRYRAAHNGYELGGDIIFELTPRLGIGIGGGYAEVSRYSPVGFDEAVPSINSAFVSTRPVLRAIPIRAGAYLTLFRKNKFGIMANAGLSYFHRSLYSGEWRKETFPGPSYILITTQAERKRAPIGFHGGIGLEYELRNNLLFYLEACGRYARFRGWRGTTVFERDEEILFTEQGILYYEVVPALSGAPRLLTVQTSPPDRPGGEPRQAVIDFSGAGLHFGIRIRL